MNEFLICVLDRGDVLMCSPRSVDGYSHIIKESTILLGCIHDQKTQFLLNTSPPNLSGHVTNVNIQNNFLPNVPDGTYSLLLATNEVIYNIEHDHTVTLSRTYKAIGYKQDTITGALFATHRLDMSGEDRIKIALEAASIYEYEIVRL